MSDPLDDLGLLLQPAPKSVRSLYDRVASRYDDFRALWMRLAGRGAEQAMLEDLAARIASQARGGDMLVSSLVREVTETGGDIQFG